MKKTIITFLFSLFFFGIMQAQVIFDPANYANETLPDGMELVDVDGDMYLKTTLAGWGSSIAVSPTSVVVNTSSTKVKMKTKYDNTPSGVPVDSLKFFIQIFDATTGWEQMAATDLAPPTEFTTVTTDLLTSGDTATSIQFAAQYKGGDWHAMEDDIIYMGVIEAFDPGAIVDPEILFDPATYEGTLPTGCEIVTIDDVKYLKATTNQWDVIVPVDKSTGEYNKMTADIKFEAGTSGITADKGNVVVNASMGSSNAGGFASADLGDFTTLTTDLVVEQAVTGIQVAVQDNSTTNWDAVDGAIVYVGKITMSYVEPELAPAPNKGSVPFTEDAIDINGLFDGAYDASTEFVCNYMAKGTVADIAEPVAGEEISENNDSYAYWYAVADMDNFYIYVDVLDNDPVNLGASESPWNNDGIEMFIDIQNRRYVGSKRYSDQHQIRINIDSDVAGSKGVISGSPAFLAEDNDTTNIDFAVVVGSTGYTIEAAIPWAAFYKNGINTNAEALAAAKAEGAIGNGTKLAFELSILDASELDVRKSILNWANNTGTDVAYNTNEYYGELTLGDGSGLINTEAKTALNVYPNPVTNVLTVDMNEVSNVQIFNIIGAKVMDNDVNGINTVNVSELNNGVYIIMATDSRGNVAVSKFNKE